jgi:hypothetical protein
LSSSISVTTEGEKENTENRTEEEKKKGESAGKTKNHKPAGTAFRSLLSFFLHIKSAEQGRRKCRKPVESGTKIAEVKLRRRMPTENRGKELKQTATLIHHRFY